jgi:hypothetical protein
VLCWADDSPRMFRQLRIGRVQLMAGIELRRAGCRWRVTKSALSMASWKMGLLLLTLAILIRIAEALDTLVHCRSPFCGSSSIARRAAAALFANASSNGIMLRTASCSNTSASPEYACDHEGSIDIAC